MAQTQNPADEFVSNVKKIPSQVVDKATLGPQRRSISQSIGDEANKASSYLKGQWDQAKTLLSSPDSDKKAPDPKDDKTAKPNTFKHGGVVQKTGLALVHKGETVIPVGHPASDSAPSSPNVPNLSHHRVVMSLHNGGLHRALGNKPGETVPEEKLDAATQSKNPHLSDTANLGRTMEHWHKK